jgi:hypothetical protein
LAIFYSPLSTPAERETRLKIMSGKLVPRRGRRLGAAWLFICLGFFLARGFGLFAQTGVELAAPVTVSADTRTADGRAVSERDFRARHYLGVYLDGERRAGPLDPQGVEYIELWIQIFWGEPTLAQHERFAALGRELIKDRMDRHDAILLQALANEMLVPADDKRLAMLELIVRKYSNSTHSPYARFCALAVLAAELPQTSDRVRRLDTEGLSLLRRAIEIGDLPPSDQEILADNLLINRWGGRLVRRRAKEVHAVFAEAGREWAWLATLLEGEVHRRKAWDARGQGWASTMTGQGWRVFETENDLAELAFERAWQLDATKPLAAARLIAVNMGQSDRAGMRLWFERALAAQIDHPQSWRAYKQALAPRWLGSREALLALADAAIATGRFDSEAPRMALKIFDDYGEELGMPADHRVFGREDVWPRVSRLFEGYLATDLPDTARARWQSDYARAAHAAGRPEVTQAQLDALGGRPIPPRMWDWNRDFSDMAQATASNKAPVLEIK